MRKFYGCIPIVAPEVPNAKAHTLHDATMPRLSRFVEKPDVLVHYDAHNVCL